MRVSEIFKPGKNTLNRLTGEYYLYDILARISRQKCTGGSRCGNSNRNANTSSGGSLHHRTPPKKIYLCDFRVEVYFGGGTRRPVLEVGKFSHYQVLSPVSAREGRRGFTLS